MIEISALKGAVYCRKFLQRRSFFRDRNSRIQISENKKCERFIKLR